jgi:hypothetical protein
MPDHAFISLVSEGVLFTKFLNKVYAHFSRNSYQFFLKNT